jgi:hypothetical protein
MASSVLTPAELADIRARVEEAWKHTPWLDAMEWVLDADRNKYLRESCWAADCAEADRQALLAALDEATREREASRQYAEGALGRATRIEADRNALSDSLSRIALELVKVEGERETERTYLNARLALVTAEADKHFVDVLNRWGKCIATIRRLRRRWQWERRRALRLREALGDARWCRDKALGERDSMRRIAQSVDGLSRYELAAERDALAAEVAALIALSTLWCQEDEDAWEDADGR